ncbi:MAG: class I SAM-dependent methyltransferase [Phycisphaerales bacterium]|jgi:SAM-dependent methyltransferase
MPSLEANKKKWASHDWGRDGEEWSTLAGGSERWWHGILLPRLLPFLKQLPPEPSILEIAPGRGRWTQYLLRHAADLTAIDIDEACLDACRARFGGRVHCVLGDGVTLGGPSERINGPIDLCFSYDSLVHAELDSMGSYVRELWRVLRPGGVAFLHHSNLADAALESGTPIHWRARSVGGSGVRERALACGLEVPLQELCTKGGPKDRALIDCISVLRKPARGAPNPQTRVLESHDFWRQIQLLGALAGPYDAAAR